VKIQVIEYRKAIPPPGPVIQTPLQRILNLVKNDWRQILRKKKLGILPGIANVHHRIKNNVPDSRVQDMRKQGAFAGLPRAR